MKNLPDIVLLHGFPLDYEMWSEQVRFFQAVGMRVLTPDLPGFGSRPGNPPHRCSIGAFAEDVHHFIARHANPPCVIGGFSMGGYVVLALLNRFPADACAAIFIDTHPAADTMETRQGRLNSIAELQAEGIGTLLRQMPDRLLSPSAPSQLRSRVADMIARQNPAGMIQAQMAAAMRIDQTPQLPEIKIPALVIGGAEDVITPPHIMQRWCSQLPGSRWVEIPGAGHLTPMEAPEAVNAAISHFVKHLPENALRK
ncbi:MAG: alpha/beta fold hydrolase [Phycisphaerae bacterium]